MVVIVAGVVVVVGVAVLIIAGGTREGQMGRMMVESGCCRRWNLSVGRLVIFAGAHCSGRAGKDGGAAVWADAARPAGPAGALCAALAVWPSECWGAAHWPLGVSRRQQVAPTFFSLRRLDFILTAPN